ncbi:MAG: M28 family metallopeptidase [Nocardioides sp.]|uniref:M28 family metallopeptidase n=1 Tax=Nocardioides sp. TaxID=35761 RepID=UPI003EFD0DA8
MGVRRPGVRAAVAAALLLALTACSGGPPATPPPARPSGQVPPAATAPSTAPAPTTPLPLVAPADLRRATAVAAATHLAGAMGPRHTTSPAFRRAARWVRGRFEAYGLEVTEERFGVPGGNSWGVPVRAGRAVNVVATPPGFDPTEPYLLVGAHLDTVPQAPGAEDNGSGVGVLLAVAEALQGRRARLPVVLVAFGAEEPRGSTDADHHYGSRHHVASMGPAGRSALRGMVSLDRVGVGEVVPVCSATGSDVRLRAALLAAAGRARVPVEECVDTASDHESFATAGLPAVRLGSTPYAGYHSPGDVPSVLNPAQLHRTGRVVLAWLGGS